MLTAAVPFFSLLPGMARSHLSDQRVLEEGGRGGEGMTEGGRERE